MLARYLSSYLIFLATFIRAVAFSVDQPPEGPLLPLLIAYGVVLGAESLLSRRVHRFLWVYLFLQAGLVVAMLVIPPHFDFLPALFFPLCIRAVLGYGWRMGLVWIGGLSLAMAVPVMQNWNWKTAGAVTVILFSGTNLLTGWIARLIRQEEHARLENQRLLAELQATHRRLQDASAQIEEHAVSQARAKMAQELHDSVTQTIFTMNLTVQAAALLAGKGDARFGEQIDRLQELARGANDEIQMLVSQLRPVSAVEGGLTTGLRRLAAERESRDGLHIDLELAGDRALPEPVALGLYRIAQEALNNVSKHAGTSQVTLRLHLDRSPAFLEVEDHGRGFESGRTDRSAGQLGLDGMAARAAELGWRLAIQSQPGRGTLVRVEEASA